MEDDGVSTRPCIHQPKRRAMGKVRHSKAGTLGPGRRWYQGIPCMRRRQMGRGAAGQRLVVLVVEDEILLRIDAMAMVDEAGFEAIAASDADEAIRILESRNDIKAVFTDVQMPGSM